MAPARRRRRCAPRALAMFSFLPVAWRRGAKRGCLSAAEFCNSRVSGRRDTDVNKVLMYSTASCPYCQRAEALLKARGVTDIDKIRVDLEPDRRAEMMARTGRRTVPQIYIGGLHVAAFDALAALDRGGRLVPMPQAAPAAAPASATD